jgi:two-component system OmpR family sensor kinase
MDPSSTAADPGETSRRWVGRPRSARVRLVALSVVLLLLALAASVLSTRVVLEQRLDERLGAEMSREAEEFAALAAGVDPATGEPFGADVERIFRVFLQRNVPSRHEMFLTYVDGDPYLRSGGQPPDRLDERLALTERWGSVDAMERGRIDVGDVGTVSYQAVPVRVDDRTAGVFVSAWFRDLEAAEIDQVVATAALLGSLVVLVAGGVVWIATGRVLRPVAEVSATARAISETDLTRRISGGGDDEIGRLVATFNDMLDRLEAAFRAQREFIDDAGHELRTPVTVIRGNLDLLDHSDPTTRAATLALVNQELDRMQRMVDDLLLLAKAERPDFVRLGPLDLDTVTVAAFERARALGERDWQLDAVAAGVIAGDGQRLVQALLQLAHNAVQHTGPGQRIGLGSSFDDTSAYLWVSDSGPGVPPAEADRIFARFGRGSAMSAARDGAGLGLAIVDSIVRAHGGRVELDRSDTGGARFTLVVPTDPPEVADPTDHAGRGTADRGTAGPALSSEATT